MRPKAASTITSQKSRALNLIQGVLGKKKLNCTATHWCSQLIGKTIIFTWLNCFEPKSIRSGLLSLIQNTKLRDTMKSELDLKCCGIFADGVNTIKVENKGYEKNLLRPCYHRIRRTVFSRKVRLNIIINGKFFRLSSK